jgi:AraC-like DNA-binding protein
VTRVLIEQMQREIDLRYAEALTLRTLSAELGRQPAYLGRLFRQQVGATVRDYLTEVRLTHAARLIRDGVKIEAVALNVGYRSKKNFYQQFKKKYGVTPVSYRDAPAVQRVDCTETDRACCTPLHNDEAEPAAALPAAAATGPTDEPTAGSLAVIIRSSTRAWRVAVNAQRELLERFDQLRVGLLITNDEGRYVAANGAAFAATGFVADQLYALTPDELFVNAPQADTRCVWQVLLWSEGRESPDANATLRTCSGEPLTVHLVTLRNFLWGRSVMRALVQSPAVRIA